MYSDWLENNNLFWLNHLIEVPSENQIGSFRVTIGRLAKRRQDFDTKKTFYFEWNKT